MILAMSLFVTMDVCVKVLIQSHHTVQVVWGRYFFHMLLLSLFLAPRLRTLLVTESLTLQLARSGLLLLTTGLFFTGLRQVPLAQASVIMYVTPLLVTALAMPILKEHVGPRRWASVAVGFIGALIIIRPGTDFFQLATLWPLGAATSYAFYQIFTRHLGHQDSVMTTLVYTAMVGAVLMSIAVPFYWSPLSPFEWQLMIASGVFGGIGHFALISAFRAAPASVVTPFMYSNLVLATGYGFFLFDELPDTWTIVGATVIIASGFYIFQRERKVKAVR